MPHRYKRYTLEQLEAEEQRLTANLNQAEKDQHTQAIAVNQRKIEIIQSYMVNSSQFKPGDIYTLKATSEHLFEIDEIVNVIAWGYLIDPTSYEKIDPTNRIAKLLVLLGDKK